MVGPQTAHAENLESIPVGQQPDDATQYKQHRQNL
jgi:hypothetical protein